MKLIVVWNLQWIHIVDSAEKYSLSLFGVRVNFTKIIAEFLQPLLELVCVFWRKVPFPFGKPATGYCSF